MRRSILLLAATELWERFSYYSLRALLVLFLVSPVAAGGFGLADAKATSIYGLFAATSYLTALPGGWVADRLLGPTRAIYLGGLLICAGNGLLVFANSLTLFGVGLACIAAGTGLLKPNVTALVARASAAESVSTDGAFTLFYLGINIGGVIGPLVSATLASATGWRGGFAVAAGGMVLGLIAFSRISAAFADTTSARPRPSWQTLLVIVTVVAAAAVTCVLVPPDRLLHSAIGLVLLTAVFGFAFLLRVAANARERGRVLLMLVLFCAASLFWAAGEQSGSTLTLFAERLVDRSLAGMRFPAALYQSIYPLYVVLFAPLFIVLWKRLSERGTEPTNVAKFGAGIFLAGLGLALAALNAHQAQQGLVGPVTLAVVYLLMSLGEILVSPVGLAAGTRLAPAGHVGFATGLWYMSLSLGGLLAGLTGGAFDLSRASGFAVAFGSLALVLGVTGILLVIAARVWAVRIRALLE